MEGRRPRSRTRKNQALNGVRQLGQSHADTAHALLSDAHSLSEHIDSDELSQAISGTRLFKTSWRGVVLSLCSVFADHGSSTWLTVTVLLLCPEVAHWGIHLRAKLLAERQHHHATFRPSPPPPLPDWFANQLHPFFVRRHHGPHLLWDDSHSCCPRCTLTTSCKRGFCRAYALSST